MTKKKLPSEQDRHILRAYKETMMHAEGGKINSVETAIELINERR